MAYPARKNNRVIMAAQIRCIKTAVRQLGMDDATYRTMLMSVAGVKSCKELTDTSFDAVMRHLRGCGFDQQSGGYWAAKKKWDALGHRSGMATAAQLARIETEWAEMSWYWEPKKFATSRLALKAFIRRVVKVDDLRFLSFDQAAQILTVLGKLQRKDELGS